MLSFFSSVFSSLRLSTMSTPEDAQQSTSDPEETSLDVPSELNMEVDTPVNEAVSESRPGTPSRAMSACSEVAEEDVFGTPPAIRRLRSSGTIATEEKTEDVVTRRSVRKPADQRFLQTDKENKKRPQDQPGIGDGFQADIPELLENGIPDEEERESVMWLPKEEFQWNPNVRKYIELARVCRSVDGDQALKHLFERDYNLAKALEDFEKLPLPQYVWKSREVQELVKKLAQGRKVQHVQKYFSEKYGYADARARVVEKRYELLHRLCYGESRWVCPAMMERTDDGIITSRRECKNCAGSSNDDVNANVSCNVCAFYNEIFGKPRVFSVSLEDDEYIQKNLDAPLDYNYEEEHFECFKESKLNQIRKNIEWTDAEKVILVRGFRELGLNFDEISNRLDNRSAEEVESFYMEFRSRYNLDELISNFDREQDAPSNPRSRRAQEDRTPTPADDSDNELDPDEVKVPIRHPKTRSTITTRNKARSAVESMA
ncbi:unnamed protein product [Bursaphelenchus xylophilus]|uniref:(pine wood nematode) hypothetical protein n=1 Tax=Bursaphelenchus xylophilus TaxID=6326 RepID=A0A1I7S401_BURXY|nr:unnamed protein product [Bursaphelenchus xylophilus]CAG9116596.1 unnamed protein product [Bursaphelenchus xylophilus]